MFSVALLSYPFKKQFKKPRVKTGFMKKADASDQEKSWRE
jgi:hypothetical protein